MTNKNYILNADDFGLSQSINKAIAEGYNNNILYSASLCANGIAFDSAVNEIMPECTDLCVGVHLNLIEGKALCSHEQIPNLTDKNNNFNNGYIQLLLKSQNKKVLEQIEIEFRAQIEKILQHFQPFHIDSHVHTHSIPKIFELTCKLAKEYNIPFVRTQFENPYITPMLSKNLNLKFPVNLIKLCLLDMFTFLNKKIIIKYGLKTNDYLTGVTYTGMMSSDTVEYGLEVLKNKNDIIVETLIHPYPETHREEYEIMSNKNMKYKIENMEFKFKTYKELSRN